MPLDITEGITLHISINSFSTNAVRTETVDSREYTVLKAMFMKGNSVMNGIFYPLEEVESSFHQLENLPVPLGHPMLNGTHVSAQNAFTKGKHDIGAFVKNVAMQGDEVWGEIWIDNEFASRSDGGKSLLAKIAEKAQIGVSTGLKIAQKIQQQGQDALGNAYNMIGRMFNFDHLAVLLDQRAAGADYGTEIVYNSDTGESLFVVNHGGQPSQHEENSMKHEFDIADLSKAERVQFQALTVNEIMEAVNRKPEAVTLDTAKDVVTNAGLLVNSKDEGEFISKEDAKILANAKKAEAERIDEMQDFIVTNSEMTKDMIANMDESALLGLYKTIEKSVEPDYSMNNTVITNAKGGADAGEFNAIDY